MSLLSKFAFAMALSVLLVPALAHDGTLDENGCHTVTSGGRLVGLHCHQPEDSDVDEVFLIIGATVLTLAAVAWLLDEMQAPSSLAASLDNPLEKRRWKIESSKDRVGIRIEIPLPR